MILPRIQAPYETEPIHRPARSGPPTGTHPAVVDDDAEAPAGAKSRLLASSGSIAIATLTSRITGFFKLMLLLAVLGGSVASSYQVASQLPNMISELVLSAVLTAIVVPVLVRAESEDPDGGSAFLRRLTTAAFTILAVATLLALAAAPMLTTHVFLHAGGKVDTQLTTALFYLLVPAVLFYGLSALFTAVLNTRQVFRPGAWAPVLNNLVVLTVLGIYYLMPGQISLDPVQMSDPKLLVLGIGLTLGVVVQALSMVPALRRQGIDLRPLWGIDERLKRTAGMAGAIILYVLISQLGLVFSTRVSSGHDAAGPAIYNTAWALLQLPYGVLGVTVLTAIMPRLSRNAAADDTPAVVDDLSVATRLTMISLLPVVVFMTLFGKPIGEALFGHGHFSAHDAGRLGEATAWSAFTLIPYALVLIHLRVFYAREQAWTPTWIVLGITVVKVSLSALAPMLASHENQVVMLLGAANGLGYTTGALIGGWLLHRSLGDLRMANVGRTLWRVVLASAAGGAVMLIVDRLLRLANLAHSLGWLGSALRVGFGGALMLTVTFAIMWLAGIPEIVGITVAISRRLGLTPKVDEVAESPPPKPYDPLMDAETMILPAIRANPVGHTGGSEFPYPVRQSDGANGHATTRSSATAYAHEGARVSDDAVTGHPPGRPRTDTGPGVGMTGTVPPAAVSGATDDILGAGMTQQENYPDPGHGPEQGVPITPMPTPASEEEAHKSPRGPKLIPGASVAGGRYRLLAAHGGARGLIFWQALDIKLDREVALTFVDADQRAAHNVGEDGPQAILSRTLRLGRISSPGLARVLDVVRGSSGGIVVAEWTPGRSLREMAETRPSPIGAARAIAALAAASELTHRSGGALSIDHPDRIRISVAGDAVMAFPGTLADADVQSDVRGLGATLYGLILARWPVLPGAPTPNSGYATVGGLRAADRSPEGGPIEPRAIRPEVPFEISAVAIRALENQGVRTAATVQHVLEQASVVDQKTEMIPSLRVGQRSNTPHALADPEAMAAEKARSTRMLLIMAALGTVIVIILGLIGWWLANLLTGGSDGTSLSSKNLGLTTSSSVPTDPGMDTAGTGVPVAASEVEVFSPQGTADNPSSAKRVLDNDLSTNWHTDTYFQQFPVLKSGLGLLATLPNPAKLTTVSINSPSAGTRVEVRFSPTDSPTLDQTLLVGHGVLNSGITDIPVKADQPMHYVLIWITALAHSPSGQYATTINDIGFTARA